MAALRCRDAKLVGGGRLRVACCGPPKGLRPWRAGHTLLELLAVLSIAAMLAAATLPSLQQLLARQQVRVAAMDLYSAIELTRALAMARGQRVLLMPAGAGGVDWRTGWLVFIDRNANLALDGGDELLFRRGRWRRASTSSLPFLPARRRFILPTMARDAVAVPPIAWRRAGARCPCGWAARCAMSRSICWAGCASAIHSSSRSIAAAWPTAEDGPGGLCCQGRPCPQRLAIGHGPGKCGASRQPPATSRQPPACEQVWMWEKLYCWI